MKKQIEVKDGGNILLINIEADNRFSITADYLKPLDDYLDDLEMTEKKAEKKGYLIDLTYYKGEKYIFTMGGCLHDEILKHRPDLKFLVDMHLSDVQEGKPTHAYENGKYWFRRDVKKGMDYLRAPIKLQIGNTFDMIYAEMLPVWRQQAKDAINLIKTF